MVEVAQNLYFKITKKALFLSLLVLSAALVFNGCSVNSIKNQVITEKNSTTLLDSIGDSHDLSVREVRLLIVHQVKAAVRGESPFPPGKTIQQILDSESAEQVETEKKQEAAEAIRKRIEAENKQLVEAMKNSLSAVLLDKAFIKSDFEKGEYKDIIGLKLYFKNNGNKSIRAFKGTFRASTVLGDDIKTIEYSADNLKKPLVAGAEMTTLTGIDFNQFNENDIKLRNASTNNMKFEWAPSAILFEDGSKMELSERGDENGR